MPARIVVEAWYPEYGTSLPEGELVPTTADVDPSVELPPERWRPIPAVEARGGETVVFVDGVRRIDALVWILGDDGIARTGLCASYAAGAVAAEAHAVIGEVAVRRSLFTTAPAVEALPTDAGTYFPATASPEGQQPLSTSIQDRLRELETEVASSASGYDLLVVDGPLSSRHRRPGMVGYVKSHRVSYLEPNLERVVSRLAPGERTPLFRTTTSFRRYSAYLRLEGEKTHPWAGIVRLELSAEAPIEEALRLVHLAAGTIPLYASVPHKDPRAPQNLFPIGGLERELRRRLGDHALVHRALKAAAARTVST